MKIDYYPSTEHEALFAAVQEKNESKDFKAHIVLACDENNWQAEDLNPWLQSQQTPVFGGVFPQVIFDKSNYETGFVLVSLRKSVEWTCVNKLSDDNESYDDTLLDVAEKWDDEKEGQTILVFADGMSSRIAALIESLFFNFGLNRNFVGGGAGSLSFEQQPCILCPDGMLKDMAIILCLPLHSGIGVAHGWKPISQPLKVTKSDKNIIQQIEYKDAFEVYREVVEEKCGKSFNSDNFFDIAKSYPFGIVKLEAEMVVRDPLMPTEDGKGLICVGEVPEECFVRILEGTPEDLICAAKSVNSLAQNDWTRRYGDRPAKSSFFIDCISRVLFLEKRIDEEIAQVASDIPLFGALTLGEIANNGDEYLEFYNKTAVLCILGDG